MEIKVQHLTRIFGSTKALDDAEQKVKILQKGEEGTLVEVDFVTTEGTAQ